VRVLREPIVLVRTVFLTPLVPVVAETLAFFAHEIVGPERVGFGGIEEGDPFGNLERSLDLGEGVPLACRVVERIAAVVLDQLGLVERPRVLVTRLSVGGVPVERREVRDVVFCSRAGMRSRLRQVGRSEVHAELLL
jgi:hypothetical protein